MISSPNKFFTIFWSKVVNFISLANDFFFNAMNWASLAGCAKTLSLTFHLQNNIPWHHTCRLSECVPLKGFWGCYLFIFVKCFGVHIVPYPRRIKWLQSDSSTDSIHLMECFTSLRFLELTLHTIMVPVARPLSLVLSKVNIMTQNLLA